LAGYFGVKMSNEIISILNRADTGNEEALTQVAEMLKIPDRNVRETILGWIADDPDRQAILVWAEREVLIQVAEMLDDTENPDRESVLAWIAEVPDRSAFLDWAEQRQIEFAERPETEREMSFSTWLRAQRGTLQEIKDEIC
jgi:hypothetical protein